MLVFLKGLAEQLDKELINWRDDYIFLMDNAAYHKGTEVRS